MSIHQRGTWSRGYRRRCLAWIRCESGANSSRASFSCNALHEKVATCACRLRVDTARSSPRAACSFLSQACCERAFLSQGRIRSQSRGCSALEHKAMPSQKAAAWNENARCPMLVIDVDDPRAATIATAQRTWSRHRSPVLRVAVMVRAFGRVGTQQHGHTWLVTVEGSTP